MARSWLALLAVPAAIALAGCGSAAAQTRHACKLTVRHTLRSVAVRTYDQAARGRNVASSVRRLARSRALGAAVARGDAAATRRALRPLLRNQIKRIVVTRGRHVLAHAGHGAALAPVHGLIRNAGRPVGRFTLSVAQDRATAEFIHELTGAQVVLGTGAPARLHEAASAATSFRATTFPRGALRIWLLTPPVNSARCGATRAATEAHTVGSVGERLARAEGSSRATQRVLRIVSHERRFKAAVAARDAAGVRARIVHFFRDRTLHVVRIRAVTASGALVNDVGGPYVLAPASATLRDGRHTIGRVTLSVQDDTGYIKLMHRMTGVDVTLRTASGRIVPGSETRGRQIFSFTTRAFPSGPLRVSLRR